MVRKNECVSLVAIFFHISYSSCLQKTLERENLSHVDPSPIKYNGTGFRNPRYLFVSHNGALHPVINETTVAVSAGYLTLIGLGFVSVINAAAKQLDAKSSSLTQNNDKNKTKVNLKTNTTSNSDNTKTRKKRKRPFSYTYTTLSPLEPYDDVSIDLMT